MNIMRFFRIACMAGLLLCASFSVSSQNEHYTLELDSANVINKAIAMREYNGMNEYIMMPLQYNANIANGQLLLVVVDEYSYYADTVYKFPASMNGIVVNDISTDPAGNIYFSGVQNNAGVLGKLNANKRLDWLKIDTNLTTISSCKYTGMQNVNLLVSGVSKKIGSKGIVNFACNQANGQMGNRKIVIGPSTSSVAACAVLGANVQNSYGITIGRISQDSILLAAYRLSSLAGSGNQTKKIKLPSPLQWHQGGSAVIAIAPDIFVAALDVRNSLLQKDGILLLKLKRSSSNLNVIDSKILYFPSPKLFVNDLVFVDDPNYDDVSINVIGQYVDNYCGSPFITKIDTNFLNSVTLTYGMAYPAHEYRNFSLEDGVYNYGQGGLVVAGSYCAYGSSFPRGGLYLTRNMPGTYWNEVLNCENELSLSYASCVFPESTALLQLWNLPSLTGASFSSLTPDGDGSFVADCYSKSGKPFKKKDIRQIGGNQSESIRLSSNNIQLLLENLPEGCSYSIYNMLGSEIQNGSLCTSSINISSLKAGVYVVRVVQTNQIVFTSKFVKH